MCEPSFRSAPFLYVRWGLDIWFSVGFSFHWFLRWPTSL